MRLHVNDITGLLDRAKTERVWGFDLETNAKKGYDNDALILTAALSPISGEAFGFVLDHPLDKTTTDDNFEERMHAIQSVLSVPTNIVTGHALWTFDMPYWKYYTGWRITAEIFDSKVAHSLIDENAENSLEWLAERFTPYTKNTMGLNRKKLVTHAPLDVLKYNMEDAMISRHLYPILVSALRQLGYA